MGTTELHLPSHLSITHFFVDGCKCRPCCLNLRIVSNNFEEQVHRFIVILRNVCQVGSSKQQLHLVARLMRAVMLSSVPTILVATYSSLGWPLRRSVQLLLVDLRQVLLE